MTGLRDANRARGTDLAHSVSRLIASVVETDACLGCRLSTHWEQPHRAASYAPPPDNEMRAIGTYRVRRELLHSGGCSSSCHRTKSCAESKYGTAHSYCDHPVWSSRHRRRPPARRVVLGARHRPVRLLVAAWRFRRVSGSRCVGTAARRSRSESVLGDDPKPTAESRVTAHRRTGRGCRRARVVASKTRVCVVGSWPFGSEWEMGYVTGPKGRVWCDALISPPQEVQADPTPTRMKTATLQRWIEAAKAHQ